MSEKPAPEAPDWSKTIFIVSALIILIGLPYIAGVVTAKFNVFPARQLKQAWVSVMAVINPDEKKDWWVADAPRHVRPVETLLEEDLQPGLVLISGLLESRLTAVRIVDRKGRLVHEWKPAWNENWKDDEGSFPEGRRPKGGRHLHGVEILSDGAIVVNFDSASTTRIDVCGSVDWKLDNLGHHSVFQSEDGRFWIPARSILDKDPVGFPWHKATLRSDEIQVISPDGEILQTIPIIGLLLKNNLHGLLYMTGASSHAIGPVKGDTMHLNDIEIFPDHMESSIFEPGDIMVSLRNISTILVFDGASLESKFISTGLVTAQHDPDFLPGDRISVFDNRPFSLAKDAGPPASRVVEIDVRTGTAHTVLDGHNASEPFFTEIEGNHQRLPNGNILLTLSGEGRVLEFTRDGRLAWRYDNRVEPDQNFRVHDAMVLPEFMNEEFFRKKVALCDE